MGDFELIIGEWTPIGDTGFQYYWDPFWQDPLFDTHEIHYLNTRAGYSRRVTVHPSSARSASYMAYMVEYHYREVEAEWLRKK